MSDSKETSMRPTRFGLVGYGAWGAQHARAIAQTAGAELVAIAAHSPASCERAHTDHHAVHTYADCAEMLQREDLDVVNVVVPSHLHFEAARAVLESGRHLLLEKPMALTLADCDALIALARARGRVVAIGHELRLSALWGKVKELIDAGAIGEPRYALIELWRRPYRQGSGGWRYDVHRVGSWVLEEPIHFFDLARWYLAAAGPPRTIYARGSCVQAAREELHDNFSALLTFPSGAYALISQTLSGFEHHQTAKLTGTDGALFASWSGAVDRTLHPKFSLKHLDDKGTVSNVPLARPSGEVFELQEEIAMVVQAVRDGLPVAADGADGRWAVALCLAAEQSIAADEPVHLNEGGEAEAPRS
jgi:myo-inositol 2-dehydrogenase/D-chiro-inositol 1-dehydrogenase